LLGGRQGSGKTSGANYISEVLKKEGYSVHVIKFADPVYAIHDYIGNFLGRLLNRPAQKKNGPLLQLIGTEIGREMFGEDIWVNAALARIAQAYETHLLDRGENARIAFVIEDLRFENELSLTYKLATKGFATKTILFDAPEDVRAARAESYRPNTSHASEASLGTFEQHFDERIDTSGPESSKNDQLRKILQSMELLSDPTVSLEDYVEHFNTLLTGWELSTGYGANFEWYYTPEGKKRLRIRDIAPQQALDPDRVSNQIKLVQETMETLDGGQAFYRE
jgi:hypothetical protein